MNNSAIALEPRLRQQAEPASVLQTEALWMVYPSGGGGVKALRGLDLEIKRGEFVAIVGSSGCGKSTLMHAMGGLLTPTAGRILVDGQELTRLNDAQRTELRRQKIGIVFQRFNLIPSLSAEGNLRLAEWLYTGSRLDTTEHQPTTRSGYRSRNAYPRQLSLCSVLLGAVVCGRLGRAGMRLG